MMTDYRLPPKQPGEETAAWCQRAAASIPPQALVELLLKHLQKERVRFHGRPLWSIVNDALGHGAGVSIAVISQYMPEARSSGP
jgi:hypothetical protein